jgi:hypothetical protein
MPDRNPPVTCSLTGCFGIKQLENVHYRAAAGVDTLSIQCSMSLLEVQPRARSWTNPEARVLLKDDSKAVNIRITDVGRGKQWH